LSTGETLSMSILLQMLKKGGVSRCMVVVVKRLEFSLRYSALLPWKLGTLFCLKIEP